MSTRHGAPGGLGRGLSALIRTNPRPEEAERSVAVMDPAAGSRSHAWGHPRLERYF